MPGQEIHTTEAADSAATEARPASPSRRAVLRRGTIAGALGLAVAAGGGSAVAAVMSSQSKGSAGAHSVADAAGSGPIVIYLADPHSGEMDIFAGTTRTHARNQAMASMVASMSAR